MTNTKPPGRLQIRITLDNVEPPVWRRVVVSEALSFQQLHDVIQRAMGWLDYHLHEFDVAGQRIGDPRQDDLAFISDGPQILPERRARLGELLGRRRKLRYWYDFGDDWWHTLAIEKRLPADPEAPPAVLVAGERACPPEDCGGPWGYAELLVALADPNHPEHEEIKEWSGDFDPEHLDLESLAHDVADAVTPRGKRRTGRSPRT